MKRSAGWNWDRVGAGASALCLVHCVGLPLLLALMPMVTEGTNRAATPVVSSAARDVLVRNGTRGFDPVCLHECCASPVDFWLHVALFGAIAPVGLVALGRGYRRHGSFDMLGLGLLGLTLLLLALVVGGSLLEGRGEMILTVAGSLCLVAAHLWNERECRCRGCGSATSRHEQPSSRVSSPFLVASSAKDACRE